MKKIVSGTALLTLLTASVQAQVAPGTILLGGSLGYSTQHREGSLGYTNTDVELEKRSEFSGSPTAGYFVAENLAIGINLDYSTGKSTPYQYILATPVGGTGGGAVVKNGEVESKTRSFSVGPMARYYSFLGDKAAFFGQLGTGYRGLRTENASTLTVPASVGGGSLTTGTGFYAQLAPGFTFFPTDKFGLEVSLRGLTYQRTKRKTNSLNSSQANANPLKSTTSAFEAGFGLSNLQLGAAIYLGR